MAVKIPFSHKVSIYYRFLTGDRSQVLAREYGISLPTVLRYANDVIEMLRNDRALPIDPVTRGFLCKTLKFQSYQFNDCVRDVLMPVLAPYLEQAKATPVTHKEGAHYTLAARVSKTTHDLFEQIVDKKAVDRPGLTSSELLREVVEFYIQTGTAPQAEVAIDGNNPIVSDLKSLLQKHGI